MTPVVLVILDGFGHRRETEGNAIALAETPFLDMLKREYPWSLLEASGEAVGVPAGQIGSSEIGHMTIGSGSVIEQDLLRISKAIKKGELEKNPAILKLVEHCKQFNSAVHLAGLVSPGGVHSHQDHLHEIISVLKKLGLNKIVIHAFTDGRDLPPQSAHEYLENLEKHLEKEGVGVIASIGGRYYAMDRDNNWDRIKKAEEAIFHCTGNLCEFKKPSEVIHDLHSQGKYDEHFEPHIFTDKEGKTISVEPNNAVFFFNFRPDRMRQIVSRVIEKSTQSNLFVVNLTEYDPSFNATIVFEKPKLETTLAKEISKAGLRQIHIAETEKYAHATYFFNGGREEKNPGEEWLLIESRKDVATHDLAPEMRAKEITDVAINLIQGNSGFASSVKNVPDSTIKKFGFETSSRSDRAPSENVVGATVERGAQDHDNEIGQKFLEESGSASSIKNVPDFLILNYANADMVGHTGNLPATIKAVEVLDQELARLYKVVKQAGGVMIITADHGNAEQVHNPDHTKHTAHTTNPVPFIITHPFLLKSSGTLADVAPTILHLFGLAIPASFTGSVLIKKE